MELKSGVPEGPIGGKWERHQFEMKLVNPANKRKHSIIVVGSGLAGASAAASLAELGYQVSCFCFQDSPRRAHSIAAQGGINAAKNYPNDGDSVDRLFYDTVKGGDFRSREANVYRLAQISVQIIDQCAAQGVPFAREYGGLLANRSFGGAQVSRTFYARGQTGQQLLLGAYQALARQIGLGAVQMHPRTEMLDVIVVNGQARGIVVRDLVSGAIASHLADAVVLATGGYSNVYFLSTNAKGCNTTAIWRAHQRGALFANPCFTQIHPTCIPVTGEHQSKLTLMSESLRNDGRVWVPRQQGDGRSPDQIPDGERDYYLERLYPSFGNLVPRDVASRRAKDVCDDGLGVGGGHQVYLDFRDAVARLGAPGVAERYGNLFEMYQRITGDDPYRVPMRIYPAPHYTMGGLWVDYNLMSTIPGLHVVGEANFSDHGANRLGASALMQGLADGYFVLPYTIGNYLAQAKLAPVSASDPEVKRVESEVAERMTKLLSVKGSRSVDSFHRELGQLMWDECGMSRNRAGLESAVDKVRTLRERFWREVFVAGAGEDLNQSLEKAGRVADFLEFAELMCEDALHREESCGGHFREEYQTPDGEAKRDDARFSYVAAWEFAGVGAAPKLSKEPLEFEYVHLSPNGVTSEARPPRVATGGAPGAGDFVRYDVPDVSPGHLVPRAAGSGERNRWWPSAKEPIAFDHDCREGICGQCGVVINGRPHGPQRHTTACQLHLRSFQDGQEIWVEPWRARAFPVLKDLVVDRSAFDRVIQAGRVHHRPHRERPRRQRRPGPETGRGPGHGRGAMHRLQWRLRRCLSQRVGHAVRGGQGQPPGTPACRASPERYSRVVKMVETMDAEGFGACTNHGECMAACPKGISVDFIAAAQSRLSPRATPGAPCPRAPGGPAPRARPSSWYRAPTGPTSRGRATPFRNNGGQLDPDRICSSPFRFRACRARRNTCPSTRTPLPATPSTAGRASGPSRWLPPFRPRPPRARSTRNRSSKNWTISRPAIPGAGHDGHRACPSPGVG